MANEQNLRPSEHKFTQKEACQVRADTMRLAVVAMEDELSLVPEAEEHIVTGVGALNVMRVLDGIDRDTPILSVGYAGSNSLPVGSRVSVGRVSTHHPHVAFLEPDFELDGDVPCYTSTDFVTETLVSEPCVFDMELAFILGMGFSDVVAEKVVSDNLSYDEYKQTKGA